MSNLVDTADRFFAEYGDAATLARSGEVTTIALYARRIGPMRIGGSLAPIGNTAAQQQFVVKVSAGEIAASAWAVKEPKRADKLTFDGRVRTVMDAKAIKDGATVGLYELEVAG